MSGIELWEKAKKLIPGGNQLFSKRSERYLPGLWPSYYTKAKGCEVWDLDGRHYYDFAQMGVGSCVLGYADEAVNRAVIECITRGSMSTLNCYEEVELAEQLVRLHPWAQMVRFARTGGEVCAMAVRIARAATGKSKIAFCGYHGWHDWYIAANLGNSKNLDGQLLPGLAPAGVPRELKETAFPFTYNRIEELEGIVKAHRGELGVIIMEPVRSADPKPGFLESVRKIASDIGAVLIFDEITSGFRMNLGGIHLTRGISPDMAVFGKALGNGFPIAAVIGKSEVMDHAQSCFISSLYWTERIGFVAALTTLEELRTRDVLVKLIAFGGRINRGWNTLAKKHDLAIEISGIPPLTRIVFKTPLAQEAQTFYTQEMLEKGFLVGAAVYTTAAYTDAIIDRFIEASDSVFGKIKEATDSGSFKNYLKGEVAHANFRRLA